MGRKPSMADDINEQILFLSYCKRENEELAKGRSPEQARKIAKKWVRS
jgi:hypothetical protein